MLVKLQFLFNAFLPNPIHSSCWNVKASVKIIHSSLRFMYVIVSDSYVLSIQNEYGHNSKAFLFNLKPHSFIHLIQKLTLYIGFNVGIVCMYCISVIIWKSEITLIYLMLVKNGNIKVYFAIYLFLILSC